ncbi:Aste57867_10372 [Aphanomyces stellatus]|uniref:Aste57867_10372 protein n=1 Tax=Aphanomyces stellatus TaxID=120398 RepID=A0A485KQP7_9STRA|nr:hypothetical protein As57867_010332 [Aphanomyces stellatus]VFT87246.1 Aste57867_10372 [Aphanomyces stellatus]
MTHSRRSLRPRPSRPPSALDADTFNRRVTLRCGRLVSYAQVGDPRGVPVICLFGQGGHRYVSYIYHLLAQAHGLRFLCVDRPGYGLSDLFAPSAADTPRPIAFVDIFDQFVAAVGISDSQRFGLMAHSAGCIYALAIAAQSSLAARLVHPVMLVAPWVDIANPHMPGMLKLAARCPKMVIAAGLKLVNASCNLSSATTSPKYTVKFLESSKDAETDAAGVTPLEPDHQHGGLAPLPLLDFMQCVQREPSNNLDDAILCLGKSPRGNGFALDAVQVPVRVFHGDKDTLVPLQAAKEYVAQLPHATLDIMSGAGHAMNSQGKLIDQVFAAIAAAAATNNTTTDAKAIS